MSSGIKTRDWKVSRAFKSIGSGTTPKSGTSEYYDEGSINWLITGDLNDGEITATSKKITPKAVSDYSTLKTYPANSLVIAMYGATIAKVGLLKIPTTVNQACCVLVPSKRIDPRYAYYYFLSSKRKLIDLGSGGGQPNISQDVVRSFKITLPEKSEQKKMVNYLDTKTQTLDKILTTKNHTHAHLSELRQAIITNAVLGTGGAAMNLQNTNIPWIGKIPAHWQVEKIKGVADIVLGKMLQSTEKEGYVLKPYLRAQNIRWEKVDVSGVNEMWFSPNEISQYRLKEGDILVSEGGEVGRAAMWHNELDECYIQNSVNRLRVHKKKILPEYLLYVLESYGQAKVFENTVNRVSIAHLTREKLKEYAIPLPPLDEQREIVANIQKRLSNIDKADALLQKSINQLEEYRSSLISNVVGGKVTI